MNNGELVRKAYSDRSRKRTATIHTGCVRTATVNVRCSQQLRQRFGVYADECPIKRYLNEYAERAIRCDLGRRVQFDRQNMRQRLAHRSASDIFSNKQK